MLQGAPAPTADAIVVFGIVAGVIAVATADLLPVSIAALWGVVAMVVGDVVRPPTPTTR